MINGRVPDTDQALLDEMLAVFQRREASYDKLLIQTALVKEDDKWKNVFTKLTPLSKEYAVKNRVLDYEGFLVANIKTNANDFCAIVEQLIKYGRLQIKGCPEVLFEGNFHNRKGNYISSDDDVLELGWPANFYNFSPAAYFDGRYPSDPLLAIEKPSFPDGSTAIKNIIGFDLVNREGWRGHILILLPNYRAKITGLRIGSKDLTIRIITNELTKENVIGKLYCDRGKESIIKDILFTEEEKVVPTDFTPQSVYFYLLSKQDSEKIDQREVSFWWLGRPLPKDVTTEIGEENVRRLIMQGESDKVEFKLRIGQRHELDEFVESVIAFANSSGGVILVGVDNNANIRGITEENISDRVTKILRSRCNPPIQPAMRMCSLDENDIFMIEVKEGNNKPYVLNDKGVYVRVGATDRIATRTELDEFYKARSAYKYT